MAGILNKTARQFNIKVLAKGKKITVRIAPGFNVVSDDVWNLVKEDAYVVSLKKKGSIDFGEHVDEQIMERDPDTEAKVKVEPVVAPGGNTQGASQGGSGDAS